MKEAEGQAAEAFDELSPRCQRTVLNVLPPHLDPTKSKMDQERNRTIIAFAQGGTIDSPIRGGSMISSDSKLKIQKNIDIDSVSPKKMADTMKSSIGTEEGPCNFQTSSARKFKQRSTSEKPSASRKNLNQSPSGK